MKKSNIIVFPAILTALLFASACTQNMGNTDNNANGSSPTPSPTEETVEFKLDDLVSAFSLTKGDITASDAAKKIKTETPTVTGLTFTEKKIISYDDKSGTFTVEVKGNKGGKNFSNRITAEGFSHPYSSTPSSKNYGDKIILDEAMENNLKLDDFINKLKNAANPGDYLDLSFNLENGKTIDFKNSEKPYKLTATFTKTSDGKIKVSPKYAPVYKKLAEGGTEETKTENIEVIGPAFLNIGYDYFKETDVFDYVAKKVRDDILKVPTDTFASEFYAFAKYSNSTPSDIFNVGDGSKFKKYQDTYKKDGGHIKIAKSDGTSDLSYAIFDPKNSSIEADDYSGSIKVNYYVQKESVISEVIAGNYSGPAIETVGAEKSGFMKVSEEFLEKNFLFSLNISGNKATAKSKWLPRNFNTELLGEKTPEGFQLKNASLVNYDNHKTDDYYLSVNGGTSLNDLAVESKQYVSVAKGKAPNEYTLLITSIRMEKKINEKELYLAFYFKGSNNPIKLTVNPYPWD
ncbi:MAG: lipoprotein 17-related variable surface protein [Treponema sp.]